MSYYIQVGHNVQDMHTGLLDGMQRINNINQELDDLQHQLLPLMQGQSGTIVQQKLAQFRDTVNEYAQQHTQSIQNSADGAAAITAADAAGMGGFA